MKIIALQAENVKKLVAIEIKPDGNLVEITGRNGQGKTSVLDAIWWALAGTSNIQGAPIRKGATEAVIRLDLGEIVVKRTFKAKEDGEYTSSLTVEGKDGARFSSPQAMLDGLLGALSFDPLAFARSDAKAQVETLRRLAPGVDFGALDAANKADYQKRTDINRRAKEARAQVNAIPLPAGAPPARVDEGALIGQLEAAAKTNAEVEKRKAGRDSAAQKVAQNRRLAEEAVTRAKAEADRLIKEAQDRAGELEREADDLQAKLDNAEALPASVDVSALREQIEAAKRANAAVDAREKREAATKTAQDLEAQAEALTKAMDDREAQKRAAIEAAKLPVPGLTFGEEGVILNGLPFDQASDAEQLRASVAIAMTLNPKLRVIRVRDGSLLDEEAMKLVADMAQERDYQVWVERVDSSGKVGFVLEDGHVRVPEAVA